MAGPRQSRSFTLSRPPSTKPRVKRSKTYTGCWTCRSRGIKCDETRPACGKCLRSNLCCEGYHVKLVWDGEHGSGGKPVERRTFLTAQNAWQPVLSPREISLALASVDASEASEASTTVQAGPFSVFAASEHPETPKASSETPEDDERHQDDEFNCEMSEVQDQDAEDIERQADCGAEQDAVVHWLQVVDAEERNGTEAFADMMRAIKQRVVPQISTYVASATSEERSLFHYWITFLSGLMIPTQHHDNPFRTVFIPLALGAPTDPDASSGNVALLHSIYAVSAFHRAQMSSSSEHLLALGIKHHRIALRHLRRNLIQPGEESQKRAVLATIITMSSIDVIRGESASWRIHLAGGRTWMQHMMKKGGVRSDGDSVLCQIFCCIDALGQSLPYLDDALEPHQDTSPDAAGLMQVRDRAYALDKIMGITKPVLEAIMRINTLSDPAYNATKGEIDDLDCFIRRNDPDVLIADLDEKYDDITRHHTCAFFCASLIYFERRLRKTPPRMMQRVVRRSLDHLEAIAAIEAEQNLNVCGLFWPVFITACEADGVCNLRDRALHMFEKGRLLGIGNIMSARRVAQEVWQRRDDDTEGSNVTWQGVMADLELDILLT